MFLGRIFLISNFEQKIYILLLELETLGSGVRRVQLGGTLHFHVVYNRST